MSAKTAARVSRSRRSAVIQAAGALLATLLALAPALFILLAPTGGYSGVSARASPGGEVVEVVRYSGQTNLWLREGLTSALPLALPVLIALLGLVSALAPLGERASAIGLLTSGVLLLLVVLVGLNSMLLVFLPAAVVMAATALVSARPLLDADEGEAPGALPADANLRDP